MIYNDMVRFVVGNLEGEEVYGRVHRGLPKRKDSEAERLNAGAVARVEDGVDRGRPGIPVIGYLGLQFAGVIRVCFVCVEHTTL